MKENKTKSIEEILQKLPEENRKEIEDTFPKCLELICCENIKWKEFQVYVPAIEMMEKILLSLSAEYILTICDELTDDMLERNVKISFVYNKHETNVYTVKQNADTLMVYISFSSKRKKQIEEKAAEKLNK